MRLPRDTSGDDLARRLRVFGYAVVRQTGGHVRLTTQREGEHHLTIPRHAALRVGTMAAVIMDVGQHLGLAREAVLAALFGER